MQTIYCLNCLDDWSQTILQMIKLDVEVLDWHGCICVIVRMVGCNSSSDSLVAASATLPAHFFRMFSFCCDQPWAHLCNYPLLNQHLDMPASTVTCQVDGLPYLGKGKVLTKADFSKCVLQMWDNQSLATDSQQLGIKRDRKQKMFGPL